jgi:hypothetical protein
MAALQMPTPPRKTAKLVLVLRLTPTDGLGCLLRQRGRAAVAGWQCPACKPLDLPLLRWLAKLVRRPQPVIPQTCILRPVVHDATARAPKALLAACACPKVLVSGAALNDLPRARCRRCGLIQSSGPRCPDGPPTMQPEPGRPIYYVHSQLARTMPGQMIRGS